MKNKKRYCLLLLLCFVSLIAVGCKKKGSSEAKDYAVAIGNSQISMEEMMYHIFISEYDGVGNEEFFQEYFGMSYWEEEDEEGVTMREQVKEETMDTAIKAEILSKEAVKKGYELTQEEKEASEAYVKELLEVMTEEQLEVSGLDEEKITNISYKISLSNKYYTDIISSFQIAEEAIRKSLDRNDYRQYDTQAIFISTEGYYDEEDKEIPLTEEEKKAAYNKIAPLLKEAKKGTDFNELADTEEDLSVDEYSFMEGDGYMEEAYEEAALKLSNGEVSDIVETEYGYYIIKMVNDNADGAYEEAVQQAIETEQERQFDEFFEELKESYPIQINEEVWAPIVMGETLVIYSPDQAKQEENLELVPEEE